MLSFTLIFISNGNRLKNGKELTNPFTGMDTFKRQVSFLNKYQSYNQRMTKGTVIVQKLLSKPLAFIMFAIYKGFIVISATISRPLFPRSDKVEQGVWNVDIS